MRWQRGRKSANVDDRRSTRGRIRRPSAKGAGGLGIGGVIVVVVAAWFFGIDPSVVLQGVSDQSSTREQTTTQRTTPGDDKLKDFVSTILAYTEDTWTPIFKEMDRDLPCAHACALHRPCVVSMRTWTGGHGAFLLPRRPQGVYRS